jgi:hypothetical protein
MDEHDGTKMHGGTSADGIADQLMQGNLLSPVKEALASRGVGNAAGAFSKAARAFSMNSGPRFAAEYPLVLNQEGNAGWNERKQNDFCFQSTRPAVVD